MKILNSNKLRFLACVFMLMDHMWATIIPGSNWLTYVGRLAFPIFAFQIAEGYYHTSDFKKYAMRLFIFGLISEIPFNLMYMSSPVFPFHQNVMFTLLLGLLSIDALEKCRKAIGTPGEYRKSIGATGECRKAIGTPVECRSCKEPRIKVIVLNILKLALYLILSVIGFVDYGAVGVLTVILFYLCRGFRGARLCQVAAMVFLNFYALKGLELPIVLGDYTWFFPAQGFAVFALLFIWLYNGEKGKTSKALQYGFYAFYPVHMLVLSCIQAMG